MKEVDIFKINDDEFVDEYDDESNIIINTE